MQKRIVSMLLVLVMVLGILPAPAYAVGGESHISVLDSAPAAAEVPAGEIYELDLSTVFSDGEGHSLTYAFSGGDFGNTRKLRTVGCISPSANRAITRWSLRLPARQAPPPVTPWQLP